MLRRRGAGIAMTGLLLASACSGGPAATRHAVFFGLDVPNSRPDLAAAIARAVGAKPTVVSLFVKLDSTFSAGSLDRIAGPGVTPFITVEPWWSGMRAPATHEPQFALTSVVNGSHDDALRAIARKIADFRRPVYLRFAHEMNGNWYPWAAGVNGNRASDYQAAWRHAHAVFAPITGSQVRWVFSPAAVQMVSRAAVPLGDLYPGDDYVDYVGLTGYNHGSATAPQTLGPTLTELRRLTSKPIILSEIGSDGPQKARWIDSVPALLAAEPRIQGFVYYSTSPQTTGATGDYRIDSDARTTAAFRHMIQTIPLT